jgi:hypothetical protein
MEKVHRMLPLRSGSFFKRYSGRPSETASKGGAPSGPPAKRLSRPKEPRRASEEAFEQEAAPSRGGGRHAEAG